MFVQELAGSCVCIFESPMSVQLVSSADAHVILTKENILLTSQTMQHCIVRNIVSLSRPTGWAYYTMMHAVSKATPMSAIFNFN